MQGRHKKKGIAAAVAAFGAAALLSAAPASADCVYAEVSYERPNQTKQYVVGPKKCVAATPWPAGVDQDTPRLGHDGVITFYGRVWVPLP